MKIYIGPYRDRIKWPWFVRDWYFAKRFGKFNYEYDETNYNWLDRMVEASVDKIMVPVNKYINEPWLDKRGRKVKVRIDDYDVWGADHTLSMIIHPVLVKLKSVKHGSPFVEDDDVPEHLRGNTEDGVEARWDWVLDEMIWAFEQGASDESYNDGQFYSGNVDWMFEKDSDTGATLSRLTFGPAHTFDVDKEAQKAHYDRIKNGLRLFAKYYFSLWD